MTAASPLEGLLPAKFIEEKMCGADAEQASCSNKVTFSEAPVITVLFVMHIFMCVKLKKKNLAEATFSAASVVAVVFLPLFRYS